MARLIAAAVASFLLADASLPPASLRSAPVFAVSVPDEMVTGQVVVRARVADENVKTVKWTVDDWSRYTSPPFELSFDTGPVPYERRVTAIALDQQRRPLYRQEAILNPGGRGLGLDFVSPVDGQQVSGPLPIELRIKVPIDDEVESLAVDVGRGDIPLSRSGSTFIGTVDVFGGATPFVAHLKTRRGRELERTVLVNARGLVTESDAHAVEQLVAVSKGGQPLEDLKKDDFVIRDEKGLCEVREAQLLKDAPLAIGFVVDTSISLRHTEELRQATANQFIEQCFTDKDTAFLMTFGPVVTRVLDWTRSKSGLKGAVLSLIDNTVAGTALYEAVQKSLYQFQGQQGARALLLLTDGHDFEGEVSEESALAYARQAGVKIYALGLTSSFEKLTPVMGKDENGQPIVVEKKSQTVIMPTNTAVLTRFTEATGGKLYLVKKPEDLPKIYKDIQHDLRTQYLVSYVSEAKRRNSFHPVEVRASRGKVHTAPGFFY